MGHSQPETRHQHPAAAALAAGAYRQAVAPPPSRRVPGPLPTRQDPRALPAGHRQPGAVPPPVPERGAVPGTLPPAAALPASLPPAVSVLAVIARPGQEAADLGAVLAAFGLSGVRLSLLCLTRGEASELNSTPDRLETVRPWELQVAASVLRISSVTVADYPDGRLGFLPAAGLAAHILRAARQQRADLLLVVDPAGTRDADTAAAAQAACLAARDAGLPVLARTRPGPGSRWEVHLGDHTSTIRARQWQAVRAHTSQRPPVPAAAPTRPGDPRPGDLARPPGPFAAGAPGPPAAGAPAPWPVPGPHAAQQQAAPMPAPGDAGPRKDVGPRDAADYQDAADYEVVRWLVTPLMA